MFEKKKREIKIILQTFFNSREEIFFSINNAEEVRRSCRPAVRGCVRRARNREEVVGRSRRIRASAEVASAICRAEEAESVGATTGNIRMAAVRTPDCDRAGNRRLRAACDVAEIDAAGNVLWERRKRRVRRRRSMGRGRVARKGRVSDNREEDRDREMERIDRAKTRRKDRAEEDLAAEVDRVDSRRVCSRPSGRRRDACNRAHRGRRVVDIGRIYLDRRPHLFHLLLLLLCRGRCTRPARRLVRLLSRRSWTFRRRCRVR